VCVHTYARRNTHHYPSPSICWAYFRPVVLKPQCASELPVELVETQIAWVQCLWEFASHSLPSDADAAGPGTILWEPLHYSPLCLDCWFPLVFSVLLALEAWSVFMNSHLLACVFSEYMIIAAWWNKDSEGSGWKLKVTEFLLCSKVLCSALSRFSLNSNIRGGL